MSGGIHSQECAQPGLTFPEPGWQTVSRQDQEIACKRSWVGFEPPFLRAFLLVSRKDVVLPNIPTAAPALSHGVRGLYTKNCHLSSVCGAARVKAAWSKEPSPEEDSQVLGFAAKLLFGNLSQDTSPVLAQTFYSWSWGSAGALACTGARHTEVLLHPRGVQTHRIRSGEVSGLSHLGTV